MTTPVNNVSAAATAAAAATQTTNAASSLNKDDFLKLLITQLSNQDPLKPMDDTQFIAQMAQFTSLQQSKTMESDLSQLNSSHQATQANSLLGQTVTLQIDKSNQTQGVVSGVDLSTGTPQLVVNGADYSLSQVIGITPTTSQ